MQDEVVNLYTYLFVYPPRNFSDAVRCICRLSKIVVPTLYSSTFIRMLIYISCACNFCENIITLPIYKNQPLELLISIEE